MIYYKAYEISTKPFIQWHSVAFSLQELTNLGLDDDPLVLPEDEVPLTEFGVYPIKIESGELVTRSTTEMDAFRDEWNIVIEKNNFSKKLENVNAETFTFDGHDFMMDDVSRLFYHAIDKVRGNQKILTAAGATYTLTDSATNIDDFLAAYYSKLHLTIKPAI